MKTIRIGTGAGFQGDRIDPAVLLAEKGELDFLVFECLGERTVALAQQARLKDPMSGYDPLLAERMRAVLPACVRNKVRVVTNMGAANVAVAARTVRSVARELGFTGLKIAAVTGDDVLAEILAGDYQIDETGRPMASIADRIVSANAYLGARPLADALDQGADVVVCGRAADPALFLGPLVHAFKWGMDDFDRLGRGTLAGHLLECAGQITGGYFADPGFKDVPDLARIGFPLGEIDEDGNAVITKVAGTGGTVSVATCKEQLLYEVHDPSRYYQPDVVADFSGVAIDKIGPDRVRISGASGKPKTGMLKVSVGYLDSYVGEGQISYAGPGAVARGRLALDILHERIKIAGIQCTEVRGELIGVNSVLETGSPDHAPNEVRLRFVGRTETMAEAGRVGHEVDSLYLNGPAGGGGVTKSAREVIGIVSTFIPEGLIRTHVEMLES